MVVLLNPSLLGGRHLRLQGGKVPWYPDTISDWYPQVAKAAPTTMHALHYTWAGQSLTRSSGQ